MCNVGSSVNDLLHGYDSLLDALPILSDRVNEIQLSTEHMATQLYVSVKFESLI